MSRFRNTWTGVRAPVRLPAARHTCAFASLALWSVALWAQVDEDVQSLPTVDVTSGSHEHSAIGRVQRIDASAVRARPLDLPDLLDQQAGLQVRRSGGFGSFATVSARGASAQQTTLTLNGLPLASTVSGDFNLGALSLKDVDRIDLYAGYAPIELGASGPGGVIDLRTELGDRPWAPSAYASYGSAATWQVGSRASFEHSTGLHGLSLGGAASANDYPIRNPNRAFDPNDPDRRREEPRRNADVERWHGLYLGQWRPHSGPAVDSLLQLNQQDQGIPDARNSEAAQTRLRSQQANLQARVRWSEPGDDVPGVTTRGFWQGSRLRYDDRRNQVGVAAQLSDTRQHHYGADVLGAGRLGPQTQWSVLARASRETHRASDALRQTENRGERDQAQLASELEWQSSNAALRAGTTLRYQSVKDRFESADSTTADTLDATTWQLGAQWQAASTLRFHANGGRSIRLPTFFERYGDRGLFIGNPNLQPETGRTLNLGLRWTTLPWRVDIEAYASLLDHAIVTQFDVLSGIGRAENADSARILGVEAQFSGTQAIGRVGHIAMVLRAAAQDTENTSDGVLSGKQLAGRFQHKAFVGLTWLLPQAYELFYEGLLERGRFYDSLNSRPAPDVRQHTVGLRRTLHLSRTRIDIGGEIRNLGDQRAQDFSAQPQPGRQFFVSVEWTLTPAP